jgi:hypothetical protein
MVGASVLALVVLALASGAPVRASVLELPTSPIGSSAVCGSGDTSWTEVFQIQNRDGQPLVLSVKVSGVGGGTVAMSPNPVPAGAKAVGTIHLPSGFSGSETHSVSFVNPQYPPGASSAPLILGSCPPSASPDTAPGPTATLPPSGVPVPADRAPARGPTPTMTDASATTATATESVSGLPAAPPTTDAPLDAGDPATSASTAASELAAAPIGASHESSPAWPWILGALAAAGVVLGLVVVRSRSGGVGPTSA